MWSEIPGPGWCRLRQGAKKQKDNVMYTDNPPPSNLPLNSIGQTTRHLTKKTEVSSRVALGERPQSFVFGDSPKGLAAPCRHGHPRQAGACANMVCTCGCPANILGSQPQTWRHHQAFPDNCHENLNFSILESNFRQNRRVKYVFGSES